MLHDVPVSTAAVAVGVPSECYRFGTMLQLQQKLSTLRLSHIRDPVPVDVAGMVLRFLETREVALNIPFLRISLWDELRLKHVATN